MNLKYFITFIILLCIEACILFTDGFIRHTVGDYFVVILLYCFVKSFFNIPVKKTALTILLFSFCVEFLQLTGLPNIEPFASSQLSKIILGTTFVFTDLIAYTLGIITVLYAEKLKLFHKLP